MRLRFRDCTLDTGTRTLTHGGASRPLAPKVYRLLEVLLDERPNAVSHEALRLKLWPDSVSGGTTIARLVNDLRTAIGDTDGPDQAVRTVHRFGYAFTAAVTEDGTQNPTAICAIKWGTLFVPLCHGEHVIGRASNSAIAVPSSRVSRQHSRLRVSSEQVTLEDLGSRNGTFLNSERITTAVTLKHGDRIGVGPALMLFSAAPEDITTSGNTAP